MGARGEGVVTLPDGNEVPVLFTNRALVEVEQATQKSILSLSREFEQGVFRIGDVAQLMLVGMRAARRDARTGGAAPTINDVYEILDQVGFSEVARVAVSAVAEVLSFSADDEGADPNV
jgi:hypothetical protein